MRGLIRRKRSAGTSPSESSVDGDVADFLQKRKGIEARKAASQTASRFTRAVKKINIIQSTRTPSSSISPQGEAALIGTAKRSEDSKVYNTVKASRAIISRFHMGIAEGDESEDDLSRVSMPGSTPSSNPSTQPRAQPRTRSPPLTDLQHHEPEVLDPCDTWEESESGPLSTSGRSRGRGRERGRVSYAASDSGLGCKDDFFEESEVTELEAAGAASAAATTSAANTRWLEAECDDLRRSMESLKM
jgi:hypothetical protein